MKFEDRFGTEITVGTRIAWPVVRNQRAEMRSGIVESILIAKTYQGIVPRFRVELDSRSQTSYRGRRHCRQWGYCRRPDHAIVIDQTPSDHVIAGGVQ